MFHRTVSRGVGSLFLAALLFLVSSPVIAQDAEPGDPFLAELWAHGDIVGYVSSEAGYAFIVQEFEHVVYEQNPDIDFTFMAINYVATSDELAMMAADIDPMPGDTRTYVHAECQRRAFPCDENCVPTPDGKFTKQRKASGFYGQCERIPEISGSCKETYKAVCYQEIHKDSACAPGNSGSTPINGWNCK